MKTTFICQLSIEVQAQIKRIATNRLSVDFSILEYEEIISNIMDSRICDIYNGENDYFTLEEITEWSNNELIFE